MRLLLHWAALLALVLAPRHGSASPPEAVHFCVSHAGSAERAALAQLERLTDGVKLALERHPRGACARRSATRARFEQRQRRIELVLSRRGRDLRRRLPWVHRVDGALVRLAAAGRLSELSLILTALLAESQPASRRQAPPRGPAPTPTTAKAPEPTTAPRHSVTPRNDVKPAPRPSARPPNAARAPRATVASSAAARTRATADQARAVAQPKQDKPRQDKPKQGRRARRPDEPGLEGAGLVRRAPAAPRRPWHHHLALDAHVSARYWDSSLWTTAIGGSLAWRGIFVRAGYQPAARWHLDQRPIEVEGLPLALGWRPRLVGWRLLRLQALVALTAERISLRRLDLPEASSHSFWQVGATFGARLMLQLPDRLELGAGVEGRWSPSDRRVEIPQGPAAVLDRFGLRMALTLGWGRADG